MGLEQPGVAQFESTAVAMVNCNEEEECEVYCIDLWLCGTVVTAGVETTDRG